MKTSLAALYRVCLIISVSMQWVLMAQPRTDAPKSFRNVEISDYQPLNGSSGWVVLQQRNLLKTDDAGKNWQDITPPSVNQQRILGVFFIDPTKAWVLHTNSDKTGLELSTSADSGRTWSTNRLGDRQRPFSFPDIPATAAIEFVDTAHGWAMVRLRAKAGYSVGRLFSTENGGQSWIELPKPPLGDPGHFATMSDGWIAGGADGDELYVTHDGGMSWQSESIPWLSAYGSKPVFGRPTFQDGRHGLLPVLHPLSSGSDLDLYSTTDGGRTWVAGEHHLLDSKVIPGSGSQPISLIDSTFITATFASNGLAVKGPHSISRPVPVDIWPNAHIVKVKFVDLQNGWILLNAGHCLGFKINCEVQVSLLATSDGGNSFTDITPPVADNRSATPHSPPHLLSPENAERQSAAASVNGGLIAPSANASYPFSTQLSTNLGFDASSTPSLPQLQNWMADPDVPYTDLGFYLNGAVNHSAHGATVDQSWVAGVAQAGWGLLPIWFGPQVGPHSTCGNCPYCVDWSITTTNADSAGRAEADKAIQAAQSIGLNSNIGLNSTIIYYDMEQYNSVCGGAAKVFVDSWVRELHAYGFAAGLYGNRSNLSNDISTISNKPDAVWIGQWPCNDGDSCQSYTPSVWNIPLFDNSLWNLNQRIHQYTGDIKPDPFTGWPLDNDISGGPVIRYTQLTNAPTIISNLVIKRPDGTLVTPSSPAFNIGQALLAEFTIKYESPINSSTVPVVLPVVTVGGRLNGDNTCTGGCPDFTHVSMTLAGGQTLKYSGTITLNSLGTYAFFTAYQRQDGSWNTNIPADPGVVTTATVMVGNACTLTSNASIMQPHGVLAAGACPGTPPAPPAPASPGTTAAPGGLINSITPTMFWTGSGDLYGLYISRYPYGSSNLVYTNESIPGSATSFTIPFGYLVDGGLYRWNMAAYNSAGWSTVSGQLYFQVNLPEVVSQPNRPIGSQSCTLGVLYSFSTGGSISSKGNQVQYRFFWGDGTDSGLLPVGTTTASKAWGSLGTYNVYVQAFSAVNTSIVSPISDSLVVTVSGASGETITTPNTPAGVVSGYAGIAYVFSTSGSVSSAGSPVQYQFDWGNGQQSGWLPVGTLQASVTWATTGTYAVRAMAQSAVNTSVTSSSSTPLTVNITSAAPPSISLAGVSPTAVALVAGGTSQVVKVKLSRSNYTGSVAIAVGSLPQGVSGGNVNPLTYNDGGIQLSATSTAASVTNQSISFTLSGAGIASVSGTFLLTVSAAAGPTTFGTASAASGVATQVHGLSVGPDGSVYLLAPAGSGIGVWKSMDRGATFGGPINVPNSAFDNNSYQVAVDSAGVIHVVWFKSLPASTETYYSQSRNGGASFTSPVIVRTGRAFNGYTTNNAISPAVASDGAGNVYVVFSAFTKDSSNNFVGYEVWVSKSTDGGLSFQPEYYITNPTTAQRTPVRVYCDLTNYYILFSDDTNHDLYFHIGSATAIWNNATRINATPGKFMYGADMAIDTFGQNIYAVFTDTTSDPEGDVMVCRSSNAGSTWGNCALANDNTYRYQDSPALVFDNYGILHVVWEDLRSNFKYQLYYSRSTDGGNSFSPNVNLTADQPGNNFTQPHIVVDRNNMLLYVSASRDYQQVVVARAGLNNPALGISGPASLPTGTVGAAYPQTMITATGGTAPYAWSASGSPAGLSINASTGVISGAPTTATGSPFSVNVTVKDANSATANKPYSLVIKPALGISGPASLPAGTVGTAYPATTITATGGTVPDTWSATGLPAGLSINPSTGVISGTPNAAMGSPFSVNVTVRDANAATAAKPYSLVINPPLGISGPTSLPADTVGVAYPATTITASGGITPYTWSATGLPAGLSINASTGAISGTPTTATGSPFSINVTVRDASSLSTSRTYGLVINRVPNISSPSSLPSGTVGVAYPSTTMTGTGGTTPYSWSATGLPPGLSINVSTGVISGTPTTATGSPFSIIITLKDSVTAIATKAYTIRISKK